MTRNELILAIVSSAANLIDGAPEVKDGVLALFHRNDDPSDDVDEIADALAHVVLGAVKAYEGISEKDVLDNDVLAQLLENIKSSIKLAQVVVVKHSA